MPVLRDADATLFETHGSRFLSFVAPARGSMEMCAWRLTVPAGSEGVPHRPTRDEVLLVLDGRLRATLDGTFTELVRGDVLHIPAGAEVQIGAGADGATAWVTTTPGLEAVMKDGSRMRPPWTL